MRWKFAFIWSILFWSCALAPTQAQEQPPTRREEESRIRPHFADYNSELRGADGRVAIEALVKRLKQLGVTNYYWLIWHAATDWDDLQVFLPKAAEAGIDVWAYVVPPSESPPRFGKNYSEPFRLDFVRWGEEIARLSIKHPNLKGWVIDDFKDNRDLFTPMYLKGVQAKSKAINPKLKFFLLTYFSDIQPQFVADYGNVIDGVVVAYLHDRDQIERTLAVLKPASRPAKSELTFPGKTLSNAGDFVEVSQSLKVLPAERYKIEFQEYDDFSGKTAGYHFKQLLVDGNVAWEEDVARGFADWKKTVVDVTTQLRGKPNATLALRLVSKQGVANFGVTWRMKDLQAENLELTSDLTAPQDWKVVSQGAFAGGFGGGAKSGSQLLFISMTGASLEEFGKFHPTEGSSAQIAKQLRISLEAWRDGKCDGVVTYCLDKSPGSRTFPYAESLFRQFDAPEMRRAEKKNP